MGKLREAFDEFKDNREDRKRDKLMRRELKAKKNYREEADVDVYKLKNINVKELNLTQEVDEATKDKIHELEQKGLALETELQDLLKKDETYNTVAKARIDEFLLYKKMTGKGMNTKEGFIKGIEGTMTLELSKIIGVNDLFKYYQDTFANTSVKNSKDLSEESKKLWANIGEKTNKELEGMGMGTSEDMLNTIKANNLEIADKRNEIEENNNIIQTLQGNLVSDVYDDNGDELQYAA